MDTLPTAEGEPDVLLHHQETDIEPAVRNLVGKKLCEGEGETNDTVGIPITFPVSTFLHPSLAGVQVASG